MTKSGSYFSGTTVALFMLFASITSAWAQNNRIHTNVSGRMRPMTAAAVPSYPLRVRGGGNLRVRAEATQTPSLFKLVVEFSPGAGRGDAALRPGQGSWLDRGMRQGEPTRLEYYVQESDAQKIIDYLRSPGSYYTFECYNTGKGYMQVTRAYTKSARID